MAAIGINVARDGSSSLNAVVSLGATWIRIVATTQHDLREYLGEARARKLSVLLVLARESFGSAPQSDIYGLYRQRYIETKLVDAIQIGNEPDLVSASSWSMQPADLVALGQSVRAAFPDTVLVCGGLAGGDPAWLRGVDLSWCDVLAVHPYAKDALNPNDLEDLPDIQPFLEQYRIYGKPLIISEWGWWADTEPRASEEVRDVMQWASTTTDIGMFCYFCLDDRMVPPFGLLTSEQQLKPRAKVFRDLAKTARPGAAWLTRQPGQPAPAPAWQWFSVEQIAAITNCPPDAIRANWPRLVEQLQHCGINDRATQIAMIATVAIETARTFEPVREAFWNSEAWRREYLRYYPYYGRGFIQLTWESNYRRYGPKIAELWGAAGWEPDFDLVGNPDQALDPDIAAASAALYFRDHGGDRTALIPQAARRGDWREVRRLVQGADAGLAEFQSMCVALTALPEPTVDPDPEPPADPRDAEIEGLRTALRHVIDVIVPTAVGSAVQREEALREAQRIKLQFLGS